MPPTTTEFYYFSHIHLFSHDDNNIHPLELATVWVAFMLVVFIIVITARQGAIHMEMFYLNTIEQLFLFVEQLDQFEDCLPYSRLLTKVL